MLNKLIFCILCKCMICNCVGISTTKSYYLMFSVFKHKVATCFIVLPHAYGDISQYLF